MSGLERLSLPLRRFRRWWFGEIKAVFGAGEGGAGGPDQRLWLDVDLTSERWAHAGDEPGAAELRRRTVVLRLTGDSVLRSEVELPAAAEENLRQVLTFEMDRQTPFTADEVLFDYRVLSRIDGRVRVLLAVAPKLPLDDMLERLASAGARVEAVVPESEPALNLLPPERRPRRRRLAGAVNTVLAVAAVALAAVALGLPLYRKMQVVEQLEPRVAQVRTEAREVRELREQIETLYREMSFVIREKERVPRMLDLWEEVTRLLPDDTWVRELDYSDGTLQLRGETSSAPRVVALLEASDMLAEVRFQAPVTQIRDGREEFFLAAQVVGAEDAGG